MWLKNVRYLDYNAGSGLTQPVKTEIIRLLESDLFFANSSSAHSVGQKLNRTLLRYKEKIAESLSVATQISQLRFTGSGTQANRSVFLEALQETNIVFLIGAGEHSSSWEMIERLRAMEKNVHEVPLLCSGQVDFQKLEDLLSSATQARTILLSLCWVNNETGVVLDLVKLSKILAQFPKVKLHLDGAQAWGKIPMNLPQTGAEWVTFAGHKVGAPSGIGLIWYRDSSKNSIKDGTENALGIIALGIAAEGLQPQSFIEHTLNLQKQLEQGLEKISNLKTKVVGRDTQRVSNTTRIVISGFEAYQNWVEKLDLAGFAVSQGSACKSAVHEPSRVLLKMGYSKGEALNTLRISTSHATSIQDIHDFVCALQEVASV